MFGKGSRIYSILAMKCPRCHEGDMFETKNPYKKMSAINKTCPHCGLRYEREMGFFFGAMYVSYMLNIALFVTCIVAYFVLLDQYIEGWLLMTIYVSLTVILIPVYYRLSRTIWINFFISYDPDKRGTK
jgi:uncharacterized protein (DUF983 family)